MNELVFIKNIKEKKNLFLKLDTFFFSVRTANVINYQNFILVGDLASQNENDLLILPKCGKKTIAEIQSFLNSLGLHLGMEIADWRANSLDFNYTPIEDSEIKIKDYDLHKDNRFYSYIDHKQGKSKLNKLVIALGTKLTIKDLAKKKVDLEFLKRQRTIGIKTISMIQFYLNHKNLEELILSKPNLRKRTQDLTNISTPDLEKIILEDIDMLRQQFDERLKKIFDFHFGFKKNVLTLDGIAKELSEAEGKKLTRERIRQIVAKMKRTMPLKVPSHSQRVFEFLQKKENKGFHSLFPQLDLLFTDTVKTKSTDIKGDRLTSFLESYCGQSEGFFQTPERVLKINFNSALLIDIFLEVPSPINKEDFEEDVMEIFGYKKEIASEAIKYMNENKLIKIFKNRIYPTQLRKHEEISHIFLNFPNGLFWKDAYEILNNSFTNNSHNLKRIVADHSINENPFLWLCDKGTYKHIKFLEIKERSDEILKNVLSIFDDKKIKKIKVIEMYNILKENNVKPACNANYYELRTILRNFGKKKGIFFKGLSSVDTIGLDKNLNTITNKDIILKIIVNSEKVIHEDTICKILQKDKAKKPSQLVSIWAEQLLSEGKVLRVGPRQWFEKEKSIKMCNIELVLQNMMNLFSNFETVSVNYFTKYINEKMDLAFSYYYYDSIFKIFAKKKNLFYSNFYLSKKNKFFSTKQLYLDYFDRDLTIKQNVENLQKKGIAVFHTQFINSAYFYN